MDRMEHVANTLTVLGRRFFAQRHRGVFGDLL